MGKTIKYIIAIIACLVLSSLVSKAQFREEAFTQTYNDQTDSTATADTADKMFSFKELFGGLAHKTDLRIGTMFVGSMVIPGLSQIYNRDWWKLPVIYGGIGTCAGLGGYYLHQYNLSKKAYEAAYAQDPNTPLRIDNAAKQTGTWLLVGAGLIYWGSLMDGVICYKKDVHPHPGRATVYSILLTRDGRQCIRSCFPDSDRHTTGNIGKSRFTGAVWPAPYISWSRTTRTTKDSREYIMKPRILTWNIQVP